MADFFAKIETILIDMWNYLYKFLCHFYDKEPDDNMTLSNPNN